MTVFSSNTILFLVLFISTSVFHRLHAQTKANSEEMFYQINDQVWKNFISTYSRNDAEGFLDIHSHDLLRISRDSRRISTFDEYYERMKTWFDNEKSAGKTRLIDFRFIERFHTEKYGFEVGIYKVTTNLELENQRDFYGKFHVLLINENGTWKILLDSDSSEKGTIGVKEFDEGFKMDYLEPFIKK